MLLVSGPGDPGRSTRRGRPGQSRRQRFLRGAAAGHHGPQPVQPLLCLAGRRRLDGLRRRWRSAVVEGCGRWLWAVLGWAVPRHQGGRQQAPGQLGSCGCRFLLSLLPAVLQVQLPQPLLCVSEKPGIQQAATQSGFYFAAYS